MRIHHAESEKQLGLLAAADAAASIRRALTERHVGRIVLATGASQFTMLSALVAQPDIDWSNVTMFHLDEYLGLPPGHPASFRHYLQQRFIGKAHPGNAVLIDAEADPADECRRLGMLVREAPIDAAFVGIGENGHLAFNDPPADFQIDDPFIVVDLDVTCRTQQVAEGWFPTLADVPVRAISMSIQQILRARQIFCAVPGPRKAEAVRACVEEEVSPWHPASILRRHASVDLYLDQASAALLGR